ncbi:phytanoyl-dioxygenase family protein [Hyaloscypha bicolor E]|uniref:Phytanoyl-dioxygenase family protein n=1 Tax=Hyaloscypha bicolor E TaxID=1095630 RepID=A0A2J6SFI0_9HELO|nr:phytanoyl-dioxygenase family protein [Hyaloscypha bicolor E]PMD49528.1 phytanoyl-dioxygenase family protein [Hyaloscypha bicolor E]
MASTQVSSGSNGPRTITPTLEELKAFSYDTLNIEAVLEALSQDGFVVLKKVVDIAHVDHLNSFMAKEADALVKNNAKPFNQGVDSNILQGPPLKDPGYLYNDVFFNPFVIQIMNAYLGANPIFNFITGNNALPRTNGLRQPVHKDITFFHPQCPFFVIANIPLCSFNPSTGSTEFWLGSHASTSGQQQVIATPESRLSNAKLRVGEPICNVLPDVVEARRQVRPPIQPSCEKGDIMLRDLRTWHAGMPNESEDYRIMLALGYQAQWYPNHTLRFKAPLSQGNFFMKHGGQPIEVRADLLPDDSDFGKLNDVFEFRRSVATSVARSRL